MNINKLESRLCENIEKLNFSKHIAKNERGVQLNLAEHTLNVFKEFLEIYFYSLIFLCGDFQ